ncbi:MAG: sigma-54-dependent Fis family transcriptional regulator [Candidatus Fermentibacteraceae bacterium]|nr:sigma-54-dependent Fis family transcriptional regulator [Candidatus Fermentibacteraceae bacterium]MBN2608421.1 sigma-54-dependent Fis family transcriptional regulator [Candidatus Fermentibacteraceae bacterium]
MKRVLIVDDDVAVTNYFMVFLMQTEVFEPTVINDSREVMKTLEEGDFDVIMLDLDMPNVSGMEILDMMNSRKINVPVLILTGVNDVDLAVKSMKRGAFDYLTKPVDDEYLLEVLDSAIEHGAVNSTIERLPKSLSREDLDNKAAFEHLPTQDPAVIRMFHQAERMAEGDLSIFIWGERGTGKESLARAVHNASPRVDRPFIAVDSGSHSQGQFSAELYGRAKEWGGKNKEMDGFLEAASGGTLFIDHIENMSLPVQVRLKRVIQTGEYYRDNSTEILKCDVRLIVASTRDLTSSKYRDTFSLDLLYHLMVNSIRIPPLRERIDDIPLLVEHFLEREVERTGKKIETVSDELMQMLKQYSFPDNVQELKNIIAFAVINTEGDTLTLNSLSPYIRERLVPGEVSGDFVPMKLHDKVADHVMKTMEYCGGVRKDAARLLDIEPDRLEELLEETGQ